MAVFHRSADFKSVGVRDNARSYEFPVIIKRSIRQRHDRGD